MNDEKTGCLAAFGELCAIAVIAALGSMLSGYTLSKLWNWFVVSTFTQAPHLSVTQAVGVMLVVGFVRARRDRERQDDEQPLGERIVEGATWIVVYNVVSLGIGWCWHLAL